MLTAEITDDRGTRTVDLTPVKRFMDRVHAMAQDSDAYPSSEYIKDLKNLTPDQFAFLGTELLAVLDNYARLYSDSINKFEEHRKVVENLQNMKALITADHDIQFWKDLYLPKLEGSEKHELKTWTHAFKAVWSGLKRYELRPNDRDFSVGQVVRLREWDHITETYSGREVFVTVTYVTRGGEWGLPNDRTVFSFVVNSRIVRQNVLQAERVR